jgi:hypothetical protein
MMNGLGIFWYAVYFISMAVFFVIAFFVTIFGAKDLKYLLSKTEKNDKK